VLKSKSRNSELQWRSDPRGAGERPETHPVMRLWAMDAWIHPSPILTDVGGLRSIMCDAARNGGVKVLGEKFCVFDNSAVTGVLVLAQSHLSIHTWPEFGMANVDLLSYGKLQGESVMQEIARSINAERVNLECVLRAIP